MKEKKWK